MSLDERPVTAGETVDETTVTSPAAEGTPRRTRWHLSIFEQQTNRIMELPEEGEILIGRGNASGMLNLEQLEVSREHARLMVRSGSLHIADLNSHNGTYLNGRRLSAGAWGLNHCDELRIGNTKLLVVRVLQPIGAESVPPPRSTLHQLLGRGYRSLHDDLQAARDSQQSLSLLYAIVPTDEVRQQVSAHFSLGLGPQDQLATGPNGVVAVLPKVDAEAALAIADQLLAGGGTAMETVQLGCASFPQHAENAENLLCAARDAARSSPAGGVRSASSLLSDIQLGALRVLVGDPTMRESYELIRRLAPSDLNVLIVGESGTGKELAALAMHTWSPRSTKPFLPLNCAAIPQSLLESELFGHVRGAFSGATTTKNGLLETASGGTLFLDEVGEMPLDMQVKLLRAVETQRIRRVGATEERPIEVRLIAATNRNLDEETRLGRFRLDLYYRLCTACIRLPPLRERPLELAELALRILNEGRARRGACPMSVSTEALFLLRAYAWPGNIRELRNAMLRAAYVAAVDETELQDCHLPEAVRDSLVPTRPALCAGDKAWLESSSRTSFRPLREELRELERRRIREALTAAGGDRAEAARLLQMPLRTLYARCKSWGLPD